MITKNKTISNKLARKIYKKDLQELTRDEVETVEDVEAMLKANIVEDLEELFGRIEEETFMLQDNVERMSEMNDVVDKIDSVSFKLEDSLSKANELEKSAQRLEDVSNLAYDLENSTRRLEQVTSEVKRYSNQIDDASHDLERNIHHLDDARY
ncbi:hypothetical protein [Staphylococcus warneri]|uniref:hypothetical protein n=2 Tax=Staphylococcus warneri TaxID=1292 RepID=UPI000EFCC09E|nr:hypothetical protein [Staphylococcus warneri]MCK6089486.1 hypothetical protein [Staphylococcus warneri]MCK6167931.1 hypothetical protein [Staphylococcus warneri]MCK6177670.1 hypothetical protein [Staphylococcus warneri]MCK6245454.1 hypothetical protein [Staphylococcus warneri]